MARKSTNIYTVYWNVLGHSVGGTVLICPRSGDYKFDGFWQIDDDDMLNDVQRN